MTRLFNAPNDFVNEMVDGFVLANSRDVRQVEGGVAERGEARPQRVAVVTGGGSGHFPAFVGLVGPGLAAAAVTGNIFASPSAEQIYTVARSVENGGGVLLCYGNYAGDVLNFDQAKRRLESDGIRCATVRVTDDVMSAPAADTHRRRGIAGDLFVLKVAGAAASLGLSLDEVERLAQKANMRCRSIGVAFGGCTFPGAASPQFDVPAGRMALGMGIHGEPGLEEQNVPSADELAEILVSTLLTDYRGAENDTAIVLLNGLGTVKYEELYVVFRSVHRHLESRGLTILDAEVGEYVTSFDMAGLSLSILWSDSELEGLWFAPAWSTGFKRAAGSTRTPHIDRGSAELPPTQWPSGDLDLSADRGRPSRASDWETADRVSVSRSVASQHAMGLTLAAFKAAASVIDAHAVELGRLDSVAGDGDHGIGMQRGSAAALEAATQAQSRAFGTRTTVELAASAWANRAGGTSGALWGVGLSAFAAELPDDSFPNATEIVAGLAAAEAAVRSAGGAAPGDKTMLDPLTVLARASRDAVADAGEGVWQRVADATSESARSTAQMIAKTGRARTHGDKSIGTEDPGARSLALVVEAVVAELTRLQLNGSPA
jgi:dihydroxyacetone kinase